jgi:DnaJ-domain-containing protein 1
MRTRCGIGPGFTASSASNSTGFESHSVQRKSEKNCFPRAKPIKQSDASRRRDLAAVFLVIKNFYNILSVRRNASDAEIRRAYRVLMKKFHPDVNHSTYASERAVQINEAYNTLSDPAAKSLYDMDLREAETTSNSAHARTRVRGRPEVPPHFRPREAPHPPTADSRPGGNFSRHSNLRCENCDALNATLRIVVTWRVYSWITWSRKIPSSGLLCNRCLVKQSLRDSGISLILGWWSIHGFLWTLSTLAKNAQGGDQPPEQNALLLRTLSQQLHAQGRSREACQALLMADKFGHHPYPENFLRSLRDQSKLFGATPFWTRFRRLQLDPFFYHAGLGVALFLVFFLLSRLTAEIRAR